MKTNKSSKTVVCKVTYTATVGTFVNTSSASITSPKTGRVLNLNHKALSYVPVLVAKLSQACARTGKGMASLTVQDLKDALNASEQARDDYKDSLGRDEVVCTAGMEETDGECEHCDALIRDRRDQGRGYRLYNYEGGL
jgi:hypothetical protein